MDTFVNPRGRPCCCAGLTATATGCPAEVGNGLFTIKLGTAGVEFGVEAIPVAIRVLCGEYVRSIMFEHEVG